MRDTQFINSVKITRRVISAGYNEVEVENEMEKIYLKTCTYVGL